MGQVYLIRHGQASFGAADYDQLSTLGAEQSALLGGWFHDCGLKFGVTAMGRHKRHRQTAEPCLAALGADAKPATALQVASGFDEFDHQEMLARHRPELADPVATRAIFTKVPNPRRAFQQVFVEAMGRWMSGGHDAEYRESWPHFRARCWDALQSLIASGGATQTIAVFTSGGPIAAITQELLGLSNARTVELNSGIFNTSVTRVLYQPGRVTLSTLNAIPHLERSGRPETITYR